MRVSKDQINETTNEIAAPISTTILTVFIIAAESSSSGERDLPPAYDDQQGFHERDVVLLHTLNATVCQ
jgi:hypothetical protein